MLGQWRGRGSVRPHSSPGGPAAPAWRCAPNCPWRPAQFTLLNCLVAAIPARERVITCEEVFELRVPLPDVVAMQTRQPNLEGAGEIPLRRLVKGALRMRPSRIVVGEVRQEECLDLTQ